MIRDVYRRAPLKVCDVYFFSGEPIEDRCDIVRFIQSKQPFPDGIEFSSPVLELNGNEEEIFAAFPKNLRYDIRRAGRDGVTMRSTAAPADREITDFCSDYRQFALMKDVALANRRKLERLRDLIVLSRASGDCGVVWHAYLADNDRLRLFYSATLPSATGDAQAMGRMNKALHWQDIRWAIAGGYRLYDFGGCNLVSPEMRGIDEFKLRFAPRVETTFNAVQPKSWKGKLAIRMAAVMGKRLTGGAP